MSSASFQGIAILGIAALAACSGSPTSVGTTAPTGPAGSEIVVTLAPKTAQVIAGGSVRFSATVTGTADDGVIWSVQEGPTGGSVTAIGVYTAPNGAGTYHVVAASHADPTRQEVAAVTVTATSVIAVSVSPSTASTTTGGSVTFRADVTGTVPGQSTAVTWSVREAGGGSIGQATGVYLAPATPGTFTVVATSVADGSRTGTASVTVTATPVIAVSVSPVSATLNACLSVTFSATLSGAANRSVVWSVQEGSAGGTITAGGVYTAPSNAGTYHVVATSQADPSKSATATVAVTDRILSVSVSPPDISVPAGGSTQFTATVTTTCGATTITYVATASGVTQLR